MRRRSWRAGAARAAVPVALALVVAVLVAGCGNDEQVVADRSEVLADVAHHVILPAYEELDRTTAELAASVAAFCATPSTATQADVQERWSSAWEAWNRTRAFRFGPLTDMRNASAIAFMVDAAKIDALVAGSDPLVGPPFTAESLAAAGSDVRGLGALEHVLFADSVGPAACAYAVAASQIVADTAALAREAWVDGISGDRPFVEQLSDPGDGAYADSQAALDDVVNGIAMALTEAARELADAEAAPPGERQPVTTHGGARVEETLRSVRSAYFGSRDGRGVDALVEGVAPESAERARELLDEAARAVDALPLSLDDASRRDLHRAYLAVRNAGTIMRAEVASELGVTLSLGDADGDS